MQVPRYWRMKKYLYQLNTNQNFPVEETQVENSIPTKETPIMQQMLANVERKSKLAVVA